MSGGDKSMDGIRDDIRTLSGGEAPQPRKEPETPRMGRKSMLLAVPAAVLAVLTFEELEALLGLRAGEFGDIAVFLPVLVILMMGDDARPACRRHWLILGATWMLAGVASGLAAAFVGWLFALFAPDFRDSVFAIIAVFAAGTAAIFLVLWSADRLTRADNLIFPRHAEDVEGGAG